MIERLYSLAGQVAVVTGGNRGIGLAIARLFAAAGARVAIVNRNAASGAEAAGTMTAEGLDVRSFPADVSRRAQTHRAVSDVLAAFGRIDILVNNAGIIARHSVAETSEADYDRVMAINLKGAWLWAQAVAPHMRAQGGGRIINIASTHALVGYPNRAVYAMTKAALVQMTRSMAIELAPQRITSNAVCPHATRTDMVAELARTNPAAYEALVADVPLGRVAEPEDVAHAALYFASPGASYITGQVIAVDGGWTTA